MERLTIHICTLFSVIIAAYVVFGCGYKHAVPCPTGVSVGGSYSKGEGTYDGDGDGKGHHKGGSSGDYEWRERTVGGGVHGRLGTVGSCPIWTGEDDETEGR
jgi:hypothetical protein